MTTGTKRWLIFIVIGYPFHLFTMLTYPLIHLYWWLFEFKEVKQKAIPKHDEIPLEPRHSAIRDGAYHDNQDDHSALTHWGMFLADSKRGWEGLTRLVGDDGNILRRWRNGREEGFDVSGDAVINWTFAAELYGRKHGWTVDAICRAANHYFRNLGTKSNQLREGAPANEDASGWVSARCNNFGLNYCPDGAMGLGQPCAGPQFYTSSALFALASRYSTRMKVIFWLHWILMGGWLWAFSPVLYTKKWKGWYVRETVMKALYVHLMVFGPRWWIVRPMTFITTKISETENDLFYSMMGWNLQRELPQVMNPFFGQEPDAVSHDDEKANIWIMPGLSIVREEARMAARASWGG